MKISKYKYILFFVFLSVLVATVYSDVASDETLLSNNSKDFNFDKGSGQDLDVSKALHRMLIAVFVVIALGTAALYASKKVLPKFAKIQGKKIRVTETLHLGSRKMLYLIEIEGRQLLVGSTGDRITTLADFIEPSMSENCSLEADSTPGE